MRDIKANSSKFINEKRWIPGKFQWQQGYGGFSYSKSQLDTIINYINNQEEHHQKETFKGEYLDLLEQYNVDYDPNFLFEWI